MKPQNSAPQETAGLPPHRKDDDPGISDRLKSLWMRVQQGFQAEPIETEAAKEVIIQQVLTTLAHASFSTADPTEVFNLILRQMQKIVAFDAAAIFLTEGETLRAKTWFGRASELPINPVIALQGDNPAAQAFRTQQPTYISDSGAIPETQSQAATLPWRSWLGMPLTSEGERLGVLMLFGERPQQFSDTDRRWARAITEYIIAALRNAHFSEWAQRGAARQSFLLEAARTLSATLNSEEVLQQLLNLTLKYFQPAAVSIALVNADGSTTFQAASGQVADQMVGLHLPPGKGIVGWVAEHGEAVWVPDTYADKRFHVQTDQQTGFRTEAIYAAPVTQKDRTVAVIEMVNPAQDMEVRETREIMSALADLAAPAIQNAMLFEQVYNAEARYQQLFDLNLDPIIILDEAGKALDLNQEAQALLGIAEASPQDALTAMGLAGDGFAEAKVALQKQKRYIWEYTLPIAEAQDRTFKAHLTALPQYRPEPSFQWLAHDITDRVALETMREQLSNMIIHDLRGPLNSIINSIELIRTAWQQKDLTMPIEQLLQISLRSAQRMDRLINTILDTARLRQGERPLAITAFDITTLLHETEEISQPMLTHRRQTLNMNLPPAPPMIQGDMDLLRRVFVNLLSNAIKFTPNGGIIDLDMVANDDEFKFSVRDNGPGIPLNEQEHIFDMYTRGSATGQIQGSGVGLAFCKLAIEAHGGRIWLNSTPGEGATFSFTLPRTLPPELT